MTGEVCDRIFVHAFVQKRRDEEMPERVQPAMDLSRDKNAEEMKWSPLEMGAAKQAHGA